MAARITGSARGSGLSTRSGLGPMLSRMIRASLLDKAIYREVAEDGALMGEAWKVVGLVILLSNGWWILSSLLNLSLRGLFYLLPLALVQVIAWLTRVLVVQVVASAWLKKPASFGQFSRALSYAHSPAILGFLPVVGQIAPLWTLVTNTAAIRDVTGSDTLKAAILAFAGFAGGMLIARAVGPILYALV